MRRLLLIVNRNAHRFTRERRVVVADALSRGFKLEEAVTEGPGHATELASEGVLDGVEVVAAYGGDGTVNEVVNGLNGSGVPLAIVPGGMANVFARSLGIPNDDAAAASRLVDDADQPGRPVTLGILDGRAFTSNCGIGLDGAIVRRVEEHQRAKKRGGDWFFVWSGLRVFFAGYDRTHPRVRVSWGDHLEHQRDALFLAIVQNARPYTYLRTRPMNLCPQAELDAGLDFIGLDSLGVGTALRIVMSSFTSGRHIEHPHVTHVRDQRRIAVECEVPLPVQLDGEYLGERDRILIQAAPDALTVLT